MAGANPFDHLGAPSTGAAPATTARDKTTIPESEAMPYFVYKVSPKLQLTYIDSKDRYQDARAIVRSLREQRAEGDDSDYRLIFAKQQGEAEKLLSTPRDERVIGED
jgi:hypothetical protein